jgi:nitrate/nitrite transport system permease protein
MARGFIARFILPFLGLAAVLVLWTVVSQTLATDLPSPWKTWTESKRYILEPFFKEGEMNQGIGRLAFYSLMRVAKGYVLALAIGTPIGFFLGLSRGFHSVPPELKRAAKQGLLVIFVKAAMCPLALGVDG